MPASNLDEVLALAGNPLPNIRVARETYHQGWRTDRAVCMES